MRGESADGGRPGGLHALTPLQVPTVADEVVDRLLAAIALGEYVPGQRLPAGRELARLLGVSRSTVNEALGRLRDAEVVARTAAERRTRLQARELTDLLGAFADATTPEQEHAADIAIHEGVLRATRNEEMARLSHDLLARVALGLPIEPYSRRVYRRALAEHTALVEAVVEGRVEDAGRAARGHFAMSTRTLRAVMSRAGAD